MALTVLYPLFFVPGACYYCIRDERTACQSTTEPRSHDAGVCVSPEMFHVYHMASLDITNSRWYTTQARVRTHQGMRTGR